MRRVRPEARALSGAVILELKVAAGLGGGRYQTRAESDGVGVGSLTVTPSPACHTCCPTLVPVVTKVESGGRQRGGGMEGGWRGVQREEAGGKEGLKVGNVQEMSSLSAELRSWV